MDEDPPSPSNAAPTSVRAVEGGSPWTPLVVAGLLVGVVAAASRAADLTVAPSNPTVAWHDAQAALTYEIPCPDGQLPDAGACVPVPIEPIPEEAVGLGGSLPRRADRPEDFQRYALPVSATGPVRAASLDDQEPLPVDAVVIPAEEGARVQPTRLDAQQGPTEVVFAGDRAGPTVITAHTVERAGRKDRYLMIYGRLASVASPGGPDQPLGTVGGQGLLLAVRKVRQGLEVKELVPNLPGDAVIASDPRNVLPLR